MKLADFIASQPSPTIEAFCARLNARLASLELKPIQAPAVCRWMLPAVHAEKRIPRPPVMRAIFAETHGAVAPNDFYDLPTLRARSVATRRVNAAAARSGRGGSLSRAGANGGAL